MPDETATPVEAQPQPLNPFEYLAKKYPGAPTEAMIQTWKLQVPGQRVRLFEFPDRARAILLRALSAPELAAIQAEAAKLSTDPAKQMIYLQNAVVVRASLWASFAAAPGGKLADTDLQTAGAAGTLNAVITDLSDFVDPAAMDDLIVDL